MKGDRAQGTGHVQVPADLTSHPSTQTPNHKPCSGARGLVGTWLCLPRAGPSRQMLRGRAMAPPSGGRVPAGNQPQAHHGLQPPVPLSPQTQLPLLLTRPAERWHA